MGDARAAPATISVQLSPVRGGRKYAQLVCEWGESVFYLQLLRIARFSRRSLLRLPFVPVRNQCYYTARLPGPARLNFYSAENSSERNVPNCGCGSYDPNSTG